MAKVITKNGKVCTVGGRIITDADGAPCVCGDVPPDDTWGCDEPPPTCLIVTLAGFQSSGCEDFASGCGLPTENEDMVSADGINGQYILRADEFGFFQHDPIFVLVKMRGSFTGDEFVAYSEMFINTGANCLGGIDDEFQAVGAEIDIAGQLCGTNERIFLSESNRYPLSDIQANIIVTDCQSPATSHAISGGTVTVSALRDCPGSLPQTYIATKCGDGSVRITVDIEARPTGMFYLDYQGDRYEITTEQSVDPAVDAAWTDQECSDDPPIGDRFIAVRCSSSTTLPPEIAYEVAPGFTEGDGIVWNQIHPAGTDPLCFWTIKYKCTDQPAPPELPLATFSQIAGDCSGVNFHKSGPCIDLDDPIDVPDGPRGNAAPDFGPRSREAYSPGPKFVDPAARALFEAQGDVFRCRGCGG